MTTTSRWAPTLGATVRFRYRPDGPADEAPPPDGKWKLISRNDRGPQHWWAMPADDDARAWLSVNHGLVISGCIDADGSDLVSSNGVRF